MADSKIDTKTLYQKARSMLSKGSIVVSGSRSRETVEAATAVMKKSGVSRLLLHEYPYHAAANARDAALTMLRVCIRHSWS
mmetsp:Transcript_9701/g.35535  ORF Transcript_9701/g.35535 Transcript_9701/m.35535 type:complete len:81 (+) Transcript_9701:4465-4707(+)